MNGDLQFVLLAALISGVALAVSLLTGRTIALTLFAPAFLLRRLEHANYYWGSVVVVGLFFLAMVGWVVHDLI